MVVRAKGGRVISGEYGNTRGIHVWDASLVAESLSLPGRGKAPSGLCQGAPLHSSFSEGVAGTLRRLSVFLYISVHLTIDL